MTVSSAGGLYPSELRPYRVVVLSPAFDEHLVRRAIDSLDRLLTRLTLQCVEDFSFRSSSRSFPLKDSPESVLPGAAWFDEQRLHADPAEPGSDDFGRELRAVIGTDVIGRSSRSARRSGAEQVGQLRWRTSSERSRRATRMAKHSRLNSSMMLSILNALPSCVRA